MYIVLLRNWVLFNITSPIIKVVYAILHNLIDHHLIRSSTEEHRLGWCWTEHYGGGLSVFTNLKQDLEYIQWGWLRISCDAADVYHMYVVPMVIGRAKRSVMRSLWLGGRWKTPYRIYFAYKHSFRSHRPNPIKSFLDYYRWHPYDDR